MLNKTALRSGRILLGAALLVALAAPAMAGNVYSWVTEDGTYAFTDDPKRIPARHREEATKRSVGALSRYERYTEISSKQEKSWSDRILERQAELREMNAAGPQVIVAGAASPTGTGFGYTIPVSGGGSSGGRSAASIRVPLDGSTIGGVVGGASVGDTAMAGYDDEPTVIESKRMRDPKSLTTRHWTFISKGGKVQTVIKGERRQRKLETLPDEDDFGYTDPTDR
ncbi:MAG: DUF4124 domain-containing protein [Spirochaetaceae bacterium]|nr:DUF4124 domain-containing protein [Myxococcales bacterium]MCB9725250.1 DUF4124 domain-containing protein [Spirochaetaceae bacterium]